jgi:hypothetical protein
MIALN